MLPFFLKIDIVENDKTEKVVVTKDNSYNSYLLWLEIQVKMCFVKKINAYSMLIIF